MRGEGQFWLEHSKLSLKFVYRHILMDSKSEPYGKAKRCNQELKVLFYKSSLSLGHKHDCFRTSEIHLCIQSRNIYLTRYCIRCWRYSTKQSRQNLILVLNPLSHTARACVFLSTCMNMQTRGSSLHLI